MLLTSKKHIQKIFYPLEIKILEILLLTITSRLHSSIIMHKSLLRIKKTTAVPKRTNKLINEIRKKRRNTSIEDEGNNGAWNEEKEERKWRKEKKKVWERGEVGAFDRTLCASSVASATTCIGRSKGDIIAGCTHRAAADGAVWWLGAVRAVHHKGGQTANETTVLAICYLDNHRRRRCPPPPRSPPAHLRLRNERDGQGKRDRENDITLPFPPTRSSSSNRRYPST